MDDDLHQLSHDDLLHEIRRLRAGIRAYRDNSGPDPTWRLAELWELLPDRAAPPSSDQGARANQVATATQAAGARQAAALTRNSLRWIAAV